MYTHNKYKFVSLNKTVHYLDVYAFTAFSDSTRMIDFRYKHRHFNSQNYFLDAEPSLSADTDQLLL